jgi:putative PIN family toxin of toxin-antitoxin system
VKIVLDTSILIRANEHSIGLARELLIRIVNSEHRLVLSNEILHELARVLRYPRLQKFYDLSENLIYDYVSFLRLSSEIVPLNPSEASTGLQASTLAWIQPMFLQWIFQCR